MFGFLKIWKWRIFHRKKKEPKQLKALAAEINKPKIDDIKPTIYPSRDMVLITTESDLRLRPVIVNNDHTLDFNKRKILIKPDRPAHIFDLDIHSLMPTKKQRFFCKILGIPRYQTFRTFALQQEGEMTHDPHSDNLDDDMKVRFEKMLMLVGKFAEADAGAVVYEGIKGVKKWFEYIPYIIICLIVAFFLFAFQVQPNM